MVRGDLVSTITRARRLAKYPLGRPQGSLPRISSAPRRSVRSASSLPRARPRPRKVARRVRRRFLIGIARNRRRNGWKERQLARRTTLRGPSDQASARSPEMGPQGERRSQYTRYSGLRANEAAPQSPFAWRGRLTRPPSSFAWTGRPTRKPCAPSQSAERRNLSWNSFSTPSAVTRRPRP